MEQVDVGTTYIKRGTGTEGRERSRAEDVPGEPDLEPDDRTPFAGADPAADDQLQIDYDAEKVPL